MTCQEKDDVKVKFKPNTIELGNPSIKSRILED